MPHWDVGAALIRRVNERHDNHLTVEVSSVESEPFVHEEKFALPILDTVCVSMLVYCWSVMLVYLCLLMFFYLCLYFATRLCPQSLPNYQQSNSVAILKDSIDRNSDCAVAC